MGRWLAAAAIAISCVGTARADYDARFIGNWVTTAKEDRFGDGGTFTAMTGDGALALGVRCIQKDLSIALLPIGADPKPLTAGDVFEVKFKTDDKPIVTTYGKAINARVIQVETTVALVKEIRDGRETAVRRADARGTSSMHVYKTAGAQKAFADLSKECPLK